MTRTVRDIAIARSGDKGNRATLSVIAHDPAHYPLLAAGLTAERVQACYAATVAGPVQRHLLPGLGAVHFVMHQALGGGVTRSLALDAHGKALSSAVLALALPDDVPDALPEAQPDARSDALPTTGAGPDGAVPSPP